MEKRLGVQESLRLVERIILAIKPLMLMQYRHFSSLLWRRRAPSDLPRMRGAPAPPARPDNRIIIVCGTREHKHRRKIVEFVLLTGRRRATFKFPM